MNKIFEIFQYRKTIKGKIFGVFLLCLIPILGIALVGNIYSIQLIQKLVMSWNTNTLSVYMDTIESDFYITTSQIATLLLNEGNYAAISEGDGSLDRVNTLQSIRSDLSTAISVSKNADGIFYYNTTTDDYIASTQDKSTLQERSDIKDRLVTYILTGRYIDFADNSEWFPMNINGNYYLFQILQLNDSIIGAWISADTLKQPLESMEDILNGKVVLTTLENNPFTEMDFIKDSNIFLAGDYSEYKIVEGNEKYLIGGIQSVAGNFNILHIIPNGSLVEGLYFIRIVIFLVGAASLVLIPVIIVYMWRKIFWPINDLKSAMVKITEGDLNVYIEEPQEWSELSMVVKSFNRMTDRIENLKINVYEEQLEKNRAQLQYLNMQIKPHFFLNTLNIIHTFAMTKDYKLIMDMSSSLMEHFRYMFKKPDSMVTVMEELDHVKNYLHIQELRYTSSFTVHIEVDKRLNHTYIPNLLIHTFVENTIKHAFTSGSSIQIFIEIQQVPIKEQDYIDILIYDDGKGFSNEILKEIEDLDIHRDNEEIHIGIMNIRRRLQLIYQEKAHIHFSNKNRQGACIHIQIPLQNEGGIV